MSDCPLTEMPVEMCGCPTHRPDLKPAKVTVTFGHAFVAKFDGWCRWCKDQIESEEEKIVRVEYSSDKEAEYVHDYCAKEMGLNR